MELTAEKFAGKKINEIYLKYTIFEDKLFQKTIYTEEVLENITENNLYRAISCYNRCIEKISNKNIKKLAICSFFQNAFFLCDDNIFDFYGKPICYLTYYQVELANVAKYFKYILTSSDVTPPEDVLNNPEKLEDWHHSVKNVEKIINKHEGGATSIMGATADDLKRIGLDNQKKVDMFKNENQKEFNIYDAINVFGSKQK